LGAANKRAKGVKWDPVTKEVITVDDEIFNGFDDWESDKDDKQFDTVKKFMIDLATVLAYCWANTWKITQGKPRSKRSMLLPYSPSLPYNLNQTQPNLIQVPFRTSPMLMKLKMTILRSQ
jgi:hypothetical protein